MRRQNSKLLVVKASGDREPFSEFKLSRSLKRAGASPKQTKSVVARIRSELREGTRTYDIHDRALQLLAQDQGVTAARYNLKRALAELGPSGHPFETFIGELMSTLGYQIAVRQIIKGACATHEVDVVGVKGSERVLVETKFHNHPGFKTDLKVALYVHARVEDIQLGQYAKRYGKALSGWLITNTKFTSQAIKYAECAGLGLIGWNHPKGRSLQNIIEGSNLVPITGLTTITSNQKKRLLQQGVVLCRQLALSPMILDQLRLSPVIKTAVLEEARILCEGASMGVSYNNFKI